VVAETHDAALWRSLRDIGYCMEPTIWIWPEHWPASWRAQIEVCSWGPRRPRTCFALSWTYNGSAGSVPAAPRRSRVLAQLLLSSGLSDCRHRAPGHHQK